MKRICVLVFSLSLSLILFSQKEILLYPDGAKDGPLTTKQECDSNPYFITDVSVARMYYYPTKVGTEKLKPTILVLPGGGYSGLAVEHEGSEVAKYLNSIGISAFVLYYRMPYGHHKVPLEDASTAMRMIRNNAEKWQVNSQKVGVIGFSAGGHLASTLGTHFTKNTRPDVLVLGYPVITMDSAYTHQGSRYLLLGDHPSKKLVKKYSNELHVTKNTPPTFIFLAKDDKTVNPENSLVFYKKLCEHHVPTEIHLYDKGGHGFGITKHHIEADKWTIELKKWLIKQNFIVK